jgi:hypothetical protein
MRAALASSAPVYFFQPDTVVRARWDNTQDTPMPPEMAVGENPPEGAIFDYYIASPAAGPVTLKIADSAGHVVRELSNVAPPADTIMPNVPEYWLQPPTVLSTAAGMHRVNWDLRYPDPPTLNYGYYGTLLDYREYTLNWHAVPGHTYRSTIVGVMVLPGTYTATLSAGGRTYTRKFTVVRDLRVTASPAALAAQVRLQQRMVAGLTASYEAVNYVVALRAALAARTGQAAGKTAATSMASAAQSLDAEFASLVTNGFGIVHRDLGRRYSDQFIADAMPTPSVVAGVDEPCKQLDATIATLAKLQATSVATLNAQFESAGVGALPAWKAPTAPACGASGR